MEADLQQFLDWRNDPAVVSASFTQDEIAMRNHRPWFLQKLASDDCGMYVVLHDAIPAGQVRFDIDRPGATINYSLGAAFRGRGLATESVRLAIAAFLADHDEITTLVAFVKTDNIASCRVFEKLGFQADGFDHEMQANRYHIDLAERPAPDSTGDD